MHITLFGGAFDPPHLGHIQVVQNFLKKNLTEKIILLPVKEHGFAKEMRDAVLRFRMLQLVVEKSLADFPVEVSDFEIRQTGTNYSFATLEEFSRQNPTAKFSFLIGSDNLQGFTKWDHYQDLLEKYPVFVYPRVGFDFTGLLPGMFPLEDVPKTEISSMEVKKRLYNHEELGTLLSLEVKNYISENHLYCNC